MNFSGHIFLFLCQYHTVLMTVAIYFQTVKSEVRKVDFSSPLLLSQDCFGYSGSFEFHANAKSLQSCPTLCNPIGVSPPGSPIPGILQARTLEWVAISFSNA